MGVRTHRLVHPDSTETFIRIGKQRIHTRAAKAHELDRRCPRARRRGKARGGLSESHAWLRLLPQRTRQRDLFSQHRRESLAVGWPAARAHEVSPARWRAVPPPSARSSKAASRPPWTIRERTLQCPPSRSTFASCVRRAPSAAPDRRSRRGSRPRFAAPGRFPSDSRRAPRDRRPKEARRAHQEGFASVRHAAESPSGPGANPVPSRRRSLRRRRHRRRLHGQRGACPPLSSNSSTRNNSAEFLITALLLLIRCSLVGVHS